MHGVEPVREQRPEQLVAEVVLVLRLVLVATGKSDDPHAVVGSAPWTLPAAGENRDLVAARGEGTADLVEVALRATPHLRPAVRVGEGDAAPGHRYRASAG